MTMAMTLDCGPAPRDLRLLGPSRSSLPFSPTKVSGDEQLGKQEVWTLGKFTRPSYKPGEARGQC